MDPTSWEITGNTLNTKEYFEDIFNRTKDTNKICISQSARVSDYCFMPTQQFSAISWREQVIF
jgi:hypothetical protein